MGVRLGCECCDEISCNCQGEMCEACLGCEECCDCDLGVEEAKFLLDG